MRSVAKRRESHSSQTKSSDNIYPTGIHITIPEHNREATLYPQELTSALLIQILSQVPEGPRWCLHPAPSSAEAHLTANTSHDYQSLQQFLSICKFP